ncbi:histidine kinase [Ideonella sp. DXS29W]|uniref:Histidine kinase n=1 Tax=Ideonella lacteola TaxID=2984193 RepID=A0ABU9BPW6_9BURK
MSTPAPSPDRIDWSQLWYPGPTRVFTDEEMARAGTDRPTRTFLMITAISIAPAAQALLQQAPDGEVPRLTGLLVAAIFAAYRAGMWLWWRPSRRRLMVLTLIYMGVFFTFALGLRWRMSPGAAREWMLTTFGILCSLSCLGFWFLSFFRAQQIEARLTEQDERARTRAVAGQLATAQIQPHFLFNSLASLQHWVDTRDDRAGPMLASLTGYLRATLPLFERSLLPLCDEVEAVRRYLEVMQARLGARLQFSVELPPDRAAALLPPGVLLTLVENAVEHGVSPRLSGGQVRVQARAEDDGATTVQVVDDGPGLPADDPDGTRIAHGRVGLANTRARLAQAFGERARLTLVNAPEGGCVATLYLPVPPAPSTVLTSTP